MAKDTDRDRSDADDDGAHRDDRPDRPSKKDADARRDGDEGDPDGDEDAPKKKKGLLQRPVLLIVAGVIFLAVVIGGLLWWLHARHFESSDDAFIDTHIVRLAPQVAGRVDAVMVDDNQLVRAGQPLVSIDSADLGTRVAQARAQRAQAQAQVDDALAQIKVNEAAYQQALADAASTQAQAVNAARDLARYEALRRLNPAAVAQQQFDQAQTAQRQAAAQHDASLKAARSRLEQVAASRTQVQSGREQVDAADASLRSAGINFGYSRIVAPVDGHVAQKTIALGNYVQPGTQMLAIVPLTVWVTANFKETQLAHMRVGQPVKIHVDACPGDRFTGRVNSIQRGAGQAFGILPPENATGNYVKVVQRVPVKITFDRTFDDCPLGPGMSVEPTVRVR